MIVPHTGKLGWNGPCQWEGKNVKKSFEKQSGHMHLTQYLHPFNITQKKNLNIVKYLWKNMFLAALYVNQEETSRMPAA